MEDKVTKLQYKNQENQTPTKEQIHWENVKTNQTRNEIELRKLKLQERRLNLVEGTEPQRDRRYISPDHVYEVPI